MQHGSYRLAQPEIVARAETPQTLGAVTSPHPHPRVTHMHQLCDGHQVSHGDLGTSKEGLVPQELVLKQLQAPVQLCQCGRQRLRGHRLAQEHREQQLVGQQVQGGPASDPSPRWVPPSSCPSHLWVSPWPPAALVSYPDRDRPPPNIQGTQWAPSAISSCPSSSCRKPSKVPHYPDTTPPPTA